MISTPKSNDWLRLEGQLCTLTLSDLFLVCVAYTYLVQMWHLRLGLVDQVFMTFIYIVCTLASWSVRACGHSFHWCYSCIMSCVKKQVALPHCGIQFYNSGLSWSLKILESPGIVKRKFQALGSP